MSSLPTVGRVCGRQRNWYYRTRERGTGDEEELVEKDPFVHCGYEGS